MKKISVILSAILSVVLLISVLILPSYASGKKLASVQSVTVTETDENEIELKWSKVSSVTGYQVYIKRGSGSWQLAVTTSKTKAEVKKLKSAEEYSVKVRAYKSSGGQKTYGYFSSTVVTSTKPDEVRNLSVKNKSETKAILSWSAVTGADGYRIYKYNKQTGKYDKLKDVSVNSAEVTVSENGGDKFRVRAYNEVKGKKYWGDASATATCGLEVIGYSKAKSIAIKDAGVSADSVREYEAELEKKGSTYYYDVEFESGKYEYEYKINAKTGAIIYKEKELR